jgi:hypothetical protein
MLTKGLITALNIYSDNDYVQIEINGELHDITGIFEDDASGNIIISVDFNEEDE